VERAVAALNEMVTGHGLLTGFATLFAGAYDPAGRTLVYVNAGQEPGLVRRCEQGGDAGAAAIVELGPTGPVLGGFPGASYEERAVVLSPGDVLALFTDGLTEAGASRKDLLELSGVAEILRESAAAAPDDPREIAARMMRRVEEAATPAGMRDDVCLLVVCAR
jgi:sigma-B regulation protein RsbU (phosphoserine phosphatase)